VGVHTTPTWRDGTWETTDDPENRNGKRGRHYSVTYTREISYT